MGRAGGRAARRPSSGSGAPGRSRSTAAEASGQSVFCTHACACSDCFRVASPPSEPALAQSVRHTHMCMLGTVSSSVLCSIVGPLEAAPCRSTWAGHATGSEDAPQDAGASGKPGSSGEAAAADGPAGEPAGGPPPRALPAGLPAAAHPPANAKGLHSYTVRTEEYAMEVLLRSRAFRFKHPRLVHVPWHAHADLEAAWEFGIQAAVAPVAADAA